MQFATSLALFLSAAIFLAVPLAAPNAAAQDKCRTVASQTATSRTCAIILPLRSVLCRA